MASTDQPQITVNICEVIWERFVKCLIYFGGVTFLARKSALEKTQLSDVLITDNLF